MPSCSVLPGERVRCNHIPWTVCAYPACASHVHRMQCACAFLLGPEEDVAAQVVRALGLQLLQRSPAAPRVELVHEDKRHGRVGVDGGL